MRGYFVDELLLITPLHHAAGVRLFGEVVGAHKAPLAVAVTEYSRAADEITVDLTQVQYLANSALETIVALARSLNPPQRLRVLAGPELRIKERLAAGEWDRIETLQLQAA
ncbi:hypothetical protein OKJ48_34905 [Streptomyces kunmingensis]|uniref:STAS domain-containing protein n=1 Tax=Streptomyces kunmingensis TaxID=68225 RepID=A0ABU6CKX4_9ACTN|nr:hypothetical protein [Streptomyces kunmingensis]MEB3965380.1 hypothetical protein [Streptomyces kunmingensis]